MRIRVTKNTARKKLAHVTVGILALPVLAFGVISVVMDLQAHATTIGFSWQKLGAGAETVPADEISGIASSSDGSKIAAIGEYGNSLYTSTDSGATWQLSLHDSRYTLRSVFSSENGDTLVALDGAGIHTSTNWGNTWTVQRSTVSQADEFNLLSSSADGSRLVAAVNNTYSDSSIYTSGDYGQTWEMQPSAGINSWRSLKVSADGSKIAAISDDNRVHTSDDFGLTWSVVAQNVDFFQPRTASSADGSVVASSSYDDNYLYLSTDYGQTWEQSIYLASPFVNISMSDDGLVIMITQQDGQVQISNNLGDTWTDIAPIDENSWNWGSVSADGNKLTAVTGSRVFTSNNQGQTWSSMQPTKQQYPPWRQVVSSADGSKIAATVYYDSTIYISNDSGATWTSATVGPTTSWASITSSDDGSKLAVASASGFIYTSDDSGDTWQLRSGSGSRVWTAIASSADGSTLLATTSGQYGNSSMFASNDYGQTWEEKTNAGIENWAYVSVSPDGIKMSALTYNGESLYTSSDGGDSWHLTPVTDNPPYISSVSYGGKGTLYVTAMGMTEPGPSMAAYASEDNGTTWSLVSTGDGMAISLLANTDESRLMAVTLHDFMENGGTNAYYLLKTSSDSGETWTGLPLISSVNISDSAPLFYVAKDGNAVILLPPTSGPIAMGKRQALTTPTLSLDNAAPTSTNPENPQRITNKRPTFTGVAYPFAEITVTVNSDPIVCTTTANSNGDWSCTLPSDIPSGVHTVMVQITNPDTNEVEELGPFYIQASETVDNTTPIGGGSGAPGGPNAPNTGIQPGSVVRIPSPASMQVTLAAEKSKRTAGLVLVVLGVATLGVSGFVGLRRRSNLQS